MNEIPPRARTAAVLFLVYGVFVLAAAVYGPTGADATGGTALFRASVRVIGIVLVAVGLFRGAHWAWLLGVVFGGFWLVMGVIGAAALATSGEASGASAGLLAVLAALAILAAAWALLLTPVVRQAYRDQRP